MRFVDRKASGAVNHRLVDRAGDVIDPLLVDGLQGRELTRCARDPKLPQRFASSVPKIPEQRTDQASNSQGGKVGGKGLQKQSDSNHHKENRSRDARPFDAGRYGRDIRHRVSDVVNDHTLVGHSHSSLIRIVRRLVSHRWKVRRILLVSLLGKGEIRIQDGMKRTVQVNVKMTQEDFDLLQKAAVKRWPDAVLTNSGIVLALAKIAARETLRKKSP